MGSGKEGEEGERGGGGGGGGDWTRLEAWSFSIQSQQPCLQDVRPISLVYAHVALLQWNVHN